MFKLREGQLPIFIVNLIVIFVFTIIFASRKNYEFLMYIGTIIFFLILILMTNHKIKYPKPVLWGLTLWALLHMLGGGIIINGDVLYSFIIINIAGEPYNIFRFDQFVHIVGFGIATLLMYYLLKSHLNKKYSWTTISIIVIMAGLGIGALNEIIEFIAVVLLPQTGVGGFYNTMLDLVADLIGAIGAMIFIRLYYKQ